LKSTLPELILGWPLVLLFIVGLYRAGSKFKQGLRKYGHLFFLMLMLGLFILFEMNMIETVHDYYFMPFIPIIFLLVGLGINRLLLKSEKRKWVFGLVLALILVIPIYSYLRVEGRWDRIGFNEDLLTYQTELRGAVPADALVCVGNDVSHHIYLYYVDKNGWGFEKDWITATELAEMIQKGCRYLYCDSRVIDQNPKIQRLFGTKVAVFGSVKVFELVLPEELSDL